MWLLCFRFFAVVSALSVGGPNWGRTELENYKVQPVELGGFPHQRQSICLPSPFLSQICLPSALQFFLPWQVLGTGRQRCLSIPIMRTHVKFCPTSEDEEKCSTSPLPNGENSNKSLKEIIRHDEREAETERLRDNANIQVNGGEVDSELFVEKERSDRAEESNLRRQNFQSGNKSTRVEEETTVSNLQSTDNFPEEDMDIASNLEEKKKEMEKWNRRISPKDSATKRKPQ